MKKIAILLSLLMIFPALLLSVSAARCVNSTLDVEYIKRTPYVDGVIGDGEYSIYPTLSYSEDIEQFTNEDDHDEYDDWDFDFYISWNEYTLSMAWSVKTNVHSTVSESNLDDMERYSSVRLIVTPAYPEAGLTKFQEYKNYLEIGVCELDSNETGIKVFNLPIGVSEDWSDHYELKSEVVRHEDKKLTVYEISIPWAITGIAVPAHDTELGVAFAVAAQEDYNVKKGVIEWNDAMLGEKNADNAAVVTLDSGCSLPDLPICSFPIIPEGFRPADSEGAIKLDVYSINNETSAELTSLYLHRNQKFNNKWAYSMLLAPVESKENVYKIVAAQQGDGENVAFEDQYEDGMIIFSLHSDGGEGLARKEAAMSLPIGTELTLWGVDIENQEFIYRNAMLYVAKTDTPDTNESADTSDLSNSNSSDSTPSSDSSANGTASSSESSDEQSADVSNSDGGVLESPIFWTVLIAVIAVIAAIVIVIKKRR